ncbi:MAG: TraM recognition domain-containing protein [Desulfovibrio sp.]|jgi:intracellular multiplication protein IcmO|nr:TraM recognition domain-containing protein [Desulfovibrio sp.]
MPRHDLHAVNPDFERRQDELVRDIRTPMQRTMDALLSREGHAIACTACAVLLPFLSVIWPLALTSILVLLCLRRARAGRDRPPMRMPACHDAAGPDGKIPAKGRNGKAEGIFHLGNDDDGRELWISRDDILTHMLILGTTGAGKTETLVSLAFNYLATGSGFIYVDPKAAPKLAMQIYTMCRMLGRDDDFMVINYMTNRPVQESPKGRTGMKPHAAVSNTQNPFAVGSANQIAQLLMAMMPGGGNDGANSIFSQNAQTVLSGLLFVLVELRDMGRLILDIAQIREYLMDTGKMIDLAEGRIKGAGDVSANAMSALQAGLATVGWRPGVSVDLQKNNFQEQYSYARAYFGRALSLMVDNYGHIFNTSHGEVDAVDVITSRRILVELIPSMDKDPKELRSMGQLCLAGVRTACGVGLGDRIQGTVSQVLGGLPTDARTPFGIVVDEYAAIETPGFEILLTQGRGLGMAVTVASQDYAGITRANAAAAEQIVSNTKVKLFMTCEDPRQTYDLIKNLAGEALIMQSQGFAADRRHGDATLRDTMGASVHRVSRVDFRDLQRQVEGQFHVFFKGSLIRGRVFYANPPLGTRQFLQLNKFLKIRSADLSKLELGRKSAWRLRCMLRARKSVIQGGTPPDAVSEPKTAKAIAACETALCALSPLGPHSRISGAIAALVEMCPTIFRERDTSPHDKGNSPKKPAGSVREAKGGKDGIPAQLRGIGRMCQEEEGKAAQDVKSLVDLARSCAGDLRDDAVPEPGPASDPPLA